LRQLLECASLLALWERTTEAKGARKVSVRHSWWGQKRQRTAAVQDDKRSPCAVK
jgi:hypothetical protein